MTRPLPPDVWARVEELFVRAAYLPPDERRAFVERHASDPDVRREVDSLLDFAGDRPSNTLHHLVEEEAIRLESGSADPGDAAAGEDRTGDRIGPYRVVREVGRGGMGVVYLARREDGDFDQRVALKLLPGALFDRAMTRRFRDERRILASLEHPGVARFLDGGTTPAGVPWVAMEYVDGEPIDVYCERNSLDLDARLALFEKVCDAVRYAHGKLIVHRDLKPDNILVGEDGEPKLLDFGIARLLEADEEAGRTATLIMTPRYASPEQIAGQIVTTSADVYSLGALLYLLTSGKKPHGDVTSRSELFRIVAQEDPVPPSEAAGRPVLAGDLDTIVLTAMRRDPEERYPSVDRLQHDIEAFRHSMPIAARPHTLAYRAGKFIARNRAAVLAGAAAIVALIVGGSAATVGLMRARTAEALTREEALVAEEVTEFLVDLFQDPAPRVSGGEDRTARQLLDRGVERIGVELEGQPALQARLRLTMGKSYAGLGDYHKADTLYTLALETAAAGDVAVQALVLAAQGDARRNLGQLDGALEVLDAATALAVARVDTTDSTTLAGTPDLTSALIDALRETGVVLAMRGVYEPALDTLLKAHRLTLRAFGEGTEREARSAGTLAYGHIVAGDREAAVSLYERRAEILARQGERSADYLIAADNLAAAYAWSGELEKAEEMYNRLLPLQEEVFGPVHPITGQTLHNLGSLYRDAGRMEEAERYLRRGLEVNTELYGPDAVGITEGLNNLALVHQDRGEWAEAERLFLRAADIRREALGPRSPRYGSVLLGVANSRRHQQKWTSAADAFREGIDIFRALGPVAPVVLTDYAQTLRQLGRVEEAEALEREVATAQALEEEEGGE